MKSPASESSPCRCGWQQKKAGYDDARELRQTMYRSWPSLQAVNEKECLGFDGTAESLIPDR